MPMGPESIHPTVMRKLEEELTKPVSITFCHSWLTREVPDNWKLPNVTIHKKGWKDTAGNYSPVSLIMVWQGYGTDHPECHHTGPTEWPRAQTQPAQI